MMTSEGLGITGGTGAPPWNYDKFDILLLLQSC